MLTIFTLSLLVSIPCLASKDIVTRNEAVKMNTVQVQSKALDLKERVSKLNSSQFCLLTGEIRGQMRAVENQITGDFELHFNAKLAIMNIVNACLDQSEGKSIDQEEVEKQALIIYESYRKLYELLK